MLFGYQPYLDNNQALLATFRDQDLKVTPKHALKNDYFESFVSIFWSKCEVNTWQETNSAVAHYKTIAEELLGSEH